MRKTHYILIFLAALVILFLVRVPLDRDYLMEQELARELFPRVLEFIGSGGDPGSVELRGPGEDEICAELSEYLARELPDGEAPVAILDLDIPPAVVPDTDVPTHEHLDRTGGEPSPSRISWSLNGDELTLQGTLGVVHIDESLSLPGWKSLLPPLVAIFLAFAFRRTLLCLFAGVWIGATLLQGGNPATGLVWTVWDGVVRHALLDQFHLEILIFIFGLVGAVGIMSRMGGITGLLKLIEGSVRGRRSTQLFTSLMGLLIFFDDYANTILVGTTMRPLSDRWRVSRERLAYLVDSTAAPVAGISILSTWVAYEMSLYADQLPLIGIDQDPYIIFIKTIPFRFYSIFTLVLVILGAATGRSFGPMLRAERRALAGELSPVSEKGSGAAALTEKALRRTAMKSGIPPRWWNGALPLLTIILITIYLVIHYGNVEGRGLLGLLDLDYLRQTILSNTQSTRALAWAATGGFALALIMARWQKLLSWREGLAAGAGNFRAILETVGILVLAWVMGLVCLELDTSQVLIAMSSARLESVPLAFPLILFLTGAAVSFATGSSWSTMAILLPNVVLLAGRLGEGTYLGVEGMLLLSIGAVLEGSIFGDHCSPISDTTILSSVASSCPHMAHVKTQAPLALTALGVAILAGYLPVAMGVPVVVSLALGALAILAILLLVGRDPAAGKSS